jgi:signal peptidase II
VMLGMLLGGALGNLTDRLFRPPGFGVGHVVDFIYVPWMMPAIFNIADSFICIAMAFFVVLTLLGVNLDGTRVPSKKQREAAEREQASAVTVADDASTASRPEHHDVP